MKSYRLLLLALLLLPASSRGDGLSDNLPDKVRAVPRKGATISNDDRRMLEEGVSNLGNEIESLRSDLKDKPARLALLPDVQIFHNAVRYALRYDEIFNPTNEIPA